MKTTVLIVGLLVLASCDPYYNEQIDALGGEAAGVRRGPEHRPGQPCLLCHDGAVGNPNRFSVAGTVYLNATDLVPAVNATVILTGADGKVFKANTNKAGNFYVNPSQFTPINPMKVEVDYSNYKAVMQSHVGRDGSCAGCHFDPVSSSSPGHVYVVDAPAVP
jgi:hypothetical protein